MVDDGQIVVDNVRFLTGCGRSLRPRSLSDSQRLTRWSHGAKAEGKGKDAKSTVDASIHG